MADRKSYSYRRPNRTVRDNLLRQAEGMHQIALREQKERDMADPAPKTIKVGPSSWSEALPLLLVVIRDGNPTGQAEARKELERMAELADRYVDLSK